MIPRLVGVVHLQPLPGSPRFGGSLDAVVEAAARDAAALAGAGFDAVVIENFGDAPFLPGAAAPITIAAMTACALAVRRAAGAAALGINVLRNDADGALAIAVATGATLVRINVHTGARVTDQGLVEGQAHRTTRRRRELGVEPGSPAGIALLCDVDVKHSAPLAVRPIAEEAHDLAERGLADAVLVTGSGTGRGADTNDLHAVLDAVRVPVLVASGATEATLAALFMPSPGGARLHGVIVGSTLRASGRAGDPVDRARAGQFAEAFRRRAGA